MTNISIVPNKITTFPTLSPSLLQARTQIWRGNTLPLILGANSPRLLPSSPLPSTSPLAPARQGACAREGEGGSTDHVLTETYHFRPETCTFRKKKHVTSQTPSPAGKAPMKPTLLDITMSIIIISSYHLHLSVVCSEEFFFVLAWVWHLCSVGPLIPSWEWKLKARNR